MTEHQGAGGRLWRAECLNCEWRVGPDRSLATVGQAAEAHADEKKHTISVQAKHRRRP